MLTTIRDSNGAHILNYLKLLNNIYEVGTVQTVPVTRR